MEENDILTETPEEKAFFDNKGAETVNVQPEPELPLEQKPEEPKPVETKEPEKPTHVPVAALLEERERWTTKYNRLESRLEKFQEMLNAQQPQREPERIDPQNDPIRAIESLNAKLERLETEKQQVGEIQAIAQFGQRQAQAYAQQQPDFYDAYNHLRQARANQLFESGVQDRQELNQTVLREEQDILKMCARMNVDPAPFMYNLAISAGYQRPQASAPKAPEPSAEEKIKIAAQAQAKATASSSKASGGSGGPIDLRTLVNLSDDEFDKATSGNNWRKLAGG